MNTTLSIINEFKQAKQKSGYTFRQISYDMDISASLLCSVVKFKKSASKRILEKMTYWMYCRNLQYLNKSKQPRN